MDRMILEINGYHDSPKFWQNFIDHLNMISYDPTLGVSLKNIRAQQKNTINADLTQYGAVFNGYHCAFGRDADFIVFKMRWS
jgi:hypothetical protein